MPSFRNMSWSRVRLWASVVIVMVASGPSVFAWNDAGHMVVARIAWLRLSADQRAKVGELLKQHPHYHSYLTHQCPPDVSKEEWAFLRAATWADYIRPPKGLSREELMTHERHKFHRGTWHYVNFPYRAGQQESNLPREPLPNETNILMQIDTSVNVLRGKIENDPGAEPGLSADANKAVRLCWLFHLIGDLHQPLHAAALVDEKLFPEPPHGDQGGNLLAIRPDSAAAPMRLHWYWDGLLTQDSGLANVSRWADDLTHDPNLTDSKLPEFAQHQQVRQWAAESYQHAKTSVYRDGNFPLVRWVDIENQSVASSKVPAVPPSDAAKSLTLARRRVTLAGYRLADSVASVFDR